MLRFSFLIIFLLGTLRAVCQSEDLEIRTGVALDKDFSKKLDAKLEFESRFDNNLSDFDVFLTELTIRYRIGKLFRIGAGYRYSIQEAYDNHRFFTNLLVREEFGRFTVTNRFRFQKELEFSELPDNVLRNKLDISYNVRKTKFEPYISGELFYQLHYKGDQIDKLRLEVGFEHKLMKRTYINFFLLRQWEINVYAPQNATIFGFKVSYKLKRKKKKKGDDK